MSVWFLRPAAIVIEGPDTLAPENEDLGGVNGDVWYFKAEAHKMEASDIWGLKSTN